VKMETLADAIDMPHARSHRREKEIRVRSFDARIPEIHL
jgi:hypothetical protein